MRRGPFREGEEGALRDRFIGLIQDYSEGKYCAGWMSGIEDEIRASGDPLWIVLAAVCNGWPGDYPDRDEEWVWRPLTDAEREIAEQAVKGLV